MGGLPDQAGQVFPVGDVSTTLGRSLNCDIQLADQNISRLHAELLWEGGRLFLVHRSQVNRSLVNNEQITDRLELLGGEEIQLADRVVLRLKIERAEAEESVEAPAVEPVDEALVEAVEATPSAYQA